VEIYDSTFESNIASESGHWDIGAIYAYGGANVEIYDSTFESNTGVRGAISALTANVEIHGSVFKSNEASWGWGGAVFFV
jgi:hypothetical protein